MSTTINNTQLAVELQEKRQQYGQIFGLRLANGFKAQDDFKSLGIKQKVFLTRETITNVTQPGRTGSTNFKNGNLLEYKQRVGELKPIKADLFLGELELYKLSISWLADKQPADPTDINSIAGQEYIMMKVMKQIQAEVNAAVYSGQLGFGFDNTNASTQASSVYQGGLNLVDGFGLKFTAGYAAGAGKDIPNINKVIGGTTLNAANALAELKKMEDIIYANTDLESYVYNDDPEQPDFNIFMPASYHSAMVDALDNLLQKETQLVRMGADGVYEFKKLPKVKLKARRWMSGVDNMFGSPADNLFYLHQDTESDIPKIQFEKFDRGVKIMIDFELDFQYADGRVITLYK